MDLSISDSCIACICDIVKRYCSIIPLSLEVEVCIRRVLVSIRIDTFGSFIFFWTIPNVLLTIHAKNLAVAVVARIFL